METSCEYGYFCNSNGDCTEEVGIGHPCLANTQCYSENCDLSSGKCDQGTLTLNTSCINNLECLSNNCQSSQCAQGTRAEDASCTDGSQCTSQKCDSGTNKCAAVLLAFGAPCTENSDCASKNCSEAFTTGLKAHKNVLSERKQICTGGGIPNDTNDLKSAGHPGDSCNNNSDCGVTGSHQMVCSVDGKCKIVSGDRHEGSTDNCIDGSSSGQGLYNLGGTSTGELICAGAAADQICTQDAGCTATTGLTCDCGSNKCALTVPGDGTALDATAGVCK